MLRNWLVTALRNFSHHRLYSFINIAGLSVGLACAIFIALFVRDELSYDTWIPGSENLYRIETSFHIPGTEDLNITGVPFAIPAAMQSQIPEVLDVTHLVPEPTTVRVNDRLFLEKVDFVDPNFFRMIRLPFVKGSSATALTQPESIVLSQIAVRKYFGSLNPIGRTMVVRDSHLVTVTGVLRDLPHNTQLVIDLVVPNTSKADSISSSDKAGGWLNVGGYGYVKLAPGGDPNVVLAKIKPILDRNIDSKKEMDIDVAGSKLVQLHLTRFRDVHLNPHGRTDVMPETAPGSWMLVYGLGTIATLIALIACFNFTNLATARAMLRAREVSLRKVVGAQRMQLIAQFLGESVLTAIISVVLSFATVETLLPFYDRLIDRPIRFSYIADWPLTLEIVLIAILCGLVGGLYPAFVLSAFRPVSTFRINASGRSGSGLVRTALVVLQFAISVGLGCAATVVSAQINYARNLDLGFQRDNIVAIARYRSLSPTACDQFLRMLRGNPAIGGATVSTLIPFNPDNNVGGVEIPGGHQIIYPKWNMIEPEFPRVYGISLLAGRNLSLARGTDINRGTSEDGVQDGRNILVNALAARSFGFGVDGAVGRTIALKITKGWAHEKIVGVLDDTKWDGSQTLAKPTIYYYNPDDISWVSVRIKSGHTQEALNFIDRTWQKFAPTKPIQRHFLEDSFDKMFTSAEQEGTLFGIFVAVAIFIACLGLFGLAAFSAERRTKEIGVRKVFGASTADVVRLLLWQFSIPVLIANVIAWPVAWYYLHNWLESYAYRITLSPLYFLAAGAAALVIAWATVLGHSVAVARANPVHALRYE